MPQNIYRIDAHKLEKSAQKNSKLKYIGFNGEGFRIYRLRYKTSMNKIVE